jgi:hypothetical protein
MKVQELGSGIYIISGIIQDLFDSYGGNLIEQCIFSGSSVNDPINSDNIFRYTHVFDKNFNSIASSNQKLIEYSQKFGELNEAQSELRKRYTEHIINSLISLNLLDISNIQCYETWASRSSRAPHIDRDESIELFDSILNQDFPKYSIVSLPFNKTSQTNSKLHILDGTTIDDLNDYFTIEKDPEFDELRYSWVLKPSFIDSSFDYVSSKILDYKSDRFISIDSLPGSVILFPGNYLHLNCNSNSGQRPLSESRISIPINCWPKIYGSAINT